MPRQSNRRFLISDAMILIAATAVGIALTRAVLPGFEAFSSGFGGAPSMRRYFLIEYALNAILPPVVSLTIAVLFLRLRQPRPRLRRVFLQPGAAACATATLAFMVAIVLIMSLWAAGSTLVHTYNVFVASGQIASYTIMGGWLVLILSGRWRPDRSWIDRAGIAIGAIWIGITVVEWLRIFSV
jgi:hypothetical protein